MKQIIPVILFLQIFLVPSTVLAEKFYISGKTGLHLAPDTHLGAADIDPSPGISLLGILYYQSDHPFRLEDETGGRDSNKRGFSTPPETFFEIPCL